MTPGALVKPARNVAEDAKMFGFGCHVDTVTVQRQVTTIVPMYFIDLSERVSRLSRNSHALTFVL